MPSLAVVTLEDARPQEHREALSTWLEEHDGFTGEAMTRDARYARPVVEMASDAIAEALRDTGRFGRVERISHPEEAQTDLVFTARLRRLRGWQAYRVEKDEPPRLLQSMGDVFIDEVLIETSDGGLVFMGQTGAMLEELPEKLDPYVVAQDAFEEAVGALAERVADIDPTGRIEPEVSMAPETVGGIEDLAQALPDGWFGSTRGEQAPRGWTGEPVCTSVEARDASRVFYHPRLGFYRPSLELWLCPAGWQGRAVFGEEERYPATVVGLAPGGRSLLLRTLGKTSWPTAAEDLAAFLALEQPELEPVLVLPTEQAPGFPQAPGNAPDTSAPFSP